MLAPFEGAYKTTLKIEKLELLFIDAVISRVTLLFFYLIFCYIVDKIASSRQFQNADGVTLPRLSIVVKGWDYFTRFISFFLFEKFIYQFHVYLTASLIHGPGEDAGFR